VAQKLRDAHTLAYRLTLESPEPKSRLTMRTLFMEPNRFRIEMDGGLVAIADGSQGKQLVLHTATKTAILLEGKALKASPGPAAAAAVGLVERLRQLTEGDAKPVGEKAIGNIRARGYLVKNKTILGDKAKLPTELTVWVDPETRLPVQIEFSDRIQGKEVRVTCSDIQIDPNVDEELFRVTPPAGYVLRKEESNLLEMDEKTFLDPEKAATALLRGFAEKHGGTFPKRIDDLTEYFDGKKPHKRGELPDAEMFQQVQTNVRFMMAIRPLKGGFGYRSTGVKLGDADKILFWYRPEGAANYRAVYGDLHAADVTEDQLPEKPKP
jgi:outer membrane lipoprotein-sorting protein